MPTYNASRTISKLVTSILNQSYSELELILVNDGSTDNTKEILYKYAKSDNRIKYIEIPNGGVSHARNVGIANSNGKYLMFADSDDELEKTFVQELVGSMKPGVCLACSGYQVKSDSGLAGFKQLLPARRWSSTEFSEALDVLLEHKAFNVLWNKIFLLNTVLNHKLKMDETISMGEDLQFVIDYLQFTQDDIITLSTTPYIYYLSNTGLQASCTDDRLRLGLKQVMKIKELCINRGSSLDPYYRELANLFYVSVLQSSDNAQTRKTIISLSEFNVVSQKSSRVLGLKRLAFLRLVKLPSVIPLKAAIWFFSRYKRLKGTVYDW